MPDDAYELACERLRVSPSKPRHQCKCPCHADSTASLSIARGNTTSLLVHCFAGCSPKDILHALDIPLTSNQDYTVSDAPQVVAEYAYKNAQGETVAIKRRLFPKSFAWMTRDGMEGRMRSGLPAGGQTNVPLYNLPTLREITPGERTIFVVEGEKDADALGALGLIATCNPEGASGAASAYTEERWGPLAQHTVAIIPDNDEPGQKHAQRVADALRAVKATVRILPLPGVTEKGDVSDFIALHGAGTPLELQAVALGIAPLPPLATPLPPVIDHTRPRPLVLDDWKAEAVIMTEPIRVIPTPFRTLNEACRRGGGRQGWRLGWHIVLAGAPGFGKTTVALNCAVHAALQGKRVGVLSLEMGRDEIMAIMLGVATSTDEKLLEATPGVMNTTFLSQAERFQAMLAERGGAVYLVDLPRSDIQTVERATRQMIEDGCELIVIDYMQRITVQGKADDYGRLTDISNMLQGTAKQSRIVTLALSQFNRGTSGGSYAPKAQGLKGSSAIEDDANQVLLIDHSTYFRHAEDWKGRGPGAVFNLNINKNRHGPLESIGLWMSHTTLTVEEVQ